MKKLIKALSLILCFCIFVGLMVILPPPVEAEAATEIPYGQLIVKNLENQYVDGKYRIRFNVTIKTDWTTVYPVTVSNIYLQNSAGKKVLTFKDFETCKESFSRDIYVAVDFSQLPSDTYYLRFTLSSVGYGGFTKSFYRSVSHQAGKITYSSSKYVTNTVGERWVKVIFRIQGLKGYKPVFEIYDSKGNKVYSKSNYDAVKGPDINYTFWWNFYKSNGNLAPSGTYTFKIKVNGKTCSKNLNLNIY